MLTVARPLRSRCLRCRWRAAPVDLDLRLAATEPGAHTAALLGKLGLGAATQSWVPVAQERKLDLRLAFERAGILGEDVEDHRGAIDRRAAEQLLQVELLRRGQLVVEHNRVGVDLEAEIAQLFGLALADEPGVIGMVAALHETPDLVGTGGVDEGREFVEAGIGLLVGGVGHPDADENNAFPEGALDERGAEGFGIRI